MNPETKHALLIICKLIVCTAFFCWIYNLWIKATLWVEKKSERQFSIFFTYVLWITGFILCTISALGWYKLLSNWIEL